MDPKYFMVREDRLYLVEQTLQLIEHMDIKQALNFTNLFRDIAFAFPFDLRFILFREMMKILQSGSQQGYHMEKSIRIRRKHLVEDGISGFNELKRKGYDLRGNISIAF